MSGRLLKNFLRGSAISLLFALALISGAFAHPADGMTPAELPDWYGGTLRLDSSASHGRLQFVDSFPSPSELTDREKYMIVGTQSSLLRGPGFRPWYEEVMSYCMYVYNKNGSLPAKLDPAQMSFDAKIADTSLSEILRSPITGEYPRLDAVEFSPGDLLVLPLSNEEMQFYADNYGYRNDWFNEDGSVRSSLVGSVFLVKVYGENSVIWQNLYYIRRAPQTEIQD